jgi:alkanesulfonate monooxygenase SsuD/methylene tetrahydromethanopterin reductase-like flavin-dependent oxidoreductase (luciferase family)
MRLKPGEIPTGFNRAPILPSLPATRTLSLKAKKFLAEYYNRSYEAIVKAALCITGSWDEVLDRLAAFIDAGARTLVLRFAARDQFAQLEKCAEALDRRALLR